VVFDILYTRNHIDKGHAHILMFADMLTHGIEMRFLAKFKS